MVKAIPVNDFVLIKPVVDEVSKGGILLVKSDEQQRPSKGEVLAVGPGIHQNGTFIPNKSKVGQTVLYQQYPVFEFDHKGVKVVFVREPQICGVVEE